MKLSKIEKQEIKNEIKKEKAPRVLDFNKEIMLKKNENLTVVELQEKVNASIKANKEFVKDENLRFQIRLDNIKKEKLSEIKNQLNKKHNINLTDKFIATVSAHTKDEKDLVKFIEEIIELVNPNQIQDLNQIQGLTNHQIFMGAVKLRQENKDKIKKEKITFKQFLMDNPNLTIKNAKKEFEKVTEKINNLEIVDEFTFLKIFFTDIFKDFSNNPEKLFAVFAKNVDSNQILPINRKQMNKNIEKLKVQSFSILKAFSKI
jgi:hypothetical protein